MSTLTQADAAISSPLGNAPPEAQLSALLHTAGIASLDGIGWIRITGGDRVRWLNGMVTNSVSDLGTGEGCYTFLLSAQGRIQGTAFVFAQVDSLLLQTGAAYVLGLIALLDRFIIMDDVELTDVSETLTGMAIIGPDAADLLGAIGLAPSSASLRLQSVAFRGKEILLIIGRSPLVPRFELWTDRATAALLHEALQNAGATPCDTATFEWLRLLEGTPRYGVDIRDRELPQETNQLDALHFSKGCYLGQEIVERIRSRGAVHRTFAGFRLEGELPPTGTPIEADGKPVGELTSVASIPLPAGNLQIALGYIRREALQRAAALRCAGAVAIPIPLPVNLD